MIYGIWIRSVGWLKGMRGAISFTEKAIARDTARRVGGEVRFIDDSLQDLEEVILSIESQKKWWQIWKR